MFPKPFQPIGFKPIWRGPVQSQHRGKRLEHLPFLGLTVVIQQLPIALRNPCVKLPFANYIKAHHISRAALSAGVLVAAMVFFVVGAGLRLLWGPVSLGPLRGTLAGRHPDGACRASTWIMTRPPSNGAATRAG